MTLSQRRTASRFLRWTFTIFLNGGSISIKPTEHSSRKQVTSRSCSESLCSRIRFKRFTSRRNRVCISSPRRYRQAEPVAEFDQKYCSTTQARLLPPLSRPSRSPQVDRSQRLLSWQDNA